MSDPVVIPSGYGQCTVFVSVTGRAKWFCCSFGYALTGASSVDNTEDLELCIAGDGALWAEDNMASQYAYEGLTTIQTGIMDQYAFDRYNRRVGTSALNPPASNASLLVRKQSGLTGRHNRGRFYMPPFMLTDASVDQLGIIGGADVGFQQGYADSTLAALATAGLPMHILHHGAGAPTEVTSLNVENLLATQRRRMR